MTLLVDLWGLFNLSFLRTYACLRLPKISCHSHFRFIMLIRMLELVSDWLVGCGLTSHSAILHLHSDGTVVQFPNLDLLPGTQRHRQLGVFSVPSLPRHGQRDIRRQHLPPCHQRVHARWGYACLDSIHSPARYLYAIAAGLSLRQR